MNPEEKEIYDILIARPKVHELMKLAIEKNLTSEQIDEVVKGIKAKNIDE